MNSYPSQNLMLSATNPNMGSGLPTPNAHCFCSKDPCNDLCQVFQTNPAEGVMVPQSLLFPPPTSKSRNNMVTVEENYMNHSPSKALKPKPSRKKRSAINKPTKTSNIPEIKHEKRIPDIDISGFDISRIPFYVCSCTGLPRVCHKWGMGGWQSSCCTCSISPYTLPMSTTRPITHLTGRKMSNSAYVRLLSRLPSEGYNFSNPVDLKNHWARPGTNMFVTIM